MVCSVDVDICTITRRSALSVSQKPGEWALDLCLLSDSFKVALHFVSRKVWLTKHPMAAAAGKKELVSLSLFIEV